MLIDKHSIFTAAAMEKAHFRPQKNFILQKTIHAQKKLLLKKTSFGIKGLNIFAAQAAPSDPRVKHCQKPRL